VNGTEIQNEILDLLSRNPFGLSASSIRFVIRNISLFPGLDTNSLVDECLILLQEKGLVREEVQNDNNHGVEMNYFLVSPVELVRNKRAKQSIFR
jgi:hypothetical protein